MAQLRQAQRSTQMNYGAHGLFQSQQIITDESSAKSGEVEDEKVIGEASKKDDDSNEKKGGGDGN